MLKKNILIISDSIKQVKKILKNSDRNDYYIYNSETLDIEGLIDIIEMKNTYLVDNLDYYNSTVVSETKKKINYIDNVFLKETKKNCYKWGTLCEGGFLSQSVLNYVIFITTLEDLFKKISFHKIIIGDYCLFKNFHDKINFKKLINKKFNIENILIIKSKKLVNFKNLYLNFREFGKLIHYFYLLIENKLNFSNDIKNKNYDYCQAVGSVHPKHTYKGLILTSSLQNAGFKTLILTYSVSLFKSKKIFSNKTDVFACENFLGFFSYFKILKEYITFLYKLYSKDSNLNKAIFFGNQFFNSILKDSLFKYIIYELPKRLILYYSLSDFKPKIKVFKPFGAPESAEYLIFSEKINKHHSTLLINFWSGFTLPKPWPYSDSKLSPQVFFAKGMDEMKKLKEEYNSKIILCEEKTKSEANLFNYSKPIHKKNIVIAYDITKLGRHLTRKDVINDIYITFEALKLNKKFRFIVNFKGHPSSGSDFMNFQIYNAFKKKYPKINVIFTKKQIVGENWLKNKDVFISRNSSLQEFAERANILNINIVSTGDKDVYKKSFTKSATKSADINEIIEERFLKNSLFDKKDLKKDNLDISQLNIDKVSIYIQAFLKNKNSIF